MSATQRPKRLYRNNPYCIGGRIIYTNGNVSNTNNLIVNTNPIDYESILKSDDEYDSVANISKTLLTLKERSAKMMAEERDKKAQAFMSEIEGYSDLINDTVMRFQDYKNKVTDIMMNELLSSDQKNERIQRAIREFTENPENLRFLQVEFPLYSSNGRQMIYNWVGEGNYDQHREYPFSHINFGNADLNEQRDKLFSKYFIESGIDLRAVAEALGIHLKEWEYDE